MINWNDYHVRVRKGIAGIGRANPDIVRGYRTLGDAGKAKASQTPQDASDSAAERKTRSFM
jgi:hypothetical protein